MITETLKNLENTIAAFAMAVRTAQINWEHKASPGKWSNKQILGHLTDSAQINLQRFVRCTYEENFKLTYEQDQWVKAQAYESAEISNIISLWIALNKQILHVLRNYPSNRLAAQCDTGKNSIEINTVDFLAADYVAHMRHHMNQILEG